MVHQINEDCPGFPWIKGIAVEYGLSTVETVFALLIFCMDYIGLHRVKVDFHGIILMKAKFNGLD